AGIKSVSATQRHRFSEQVGQPPGKARARAEAVLVIAANAVIVAQLRHSRWNRAAGKVLRHHVSGDAARGPRVRIGQQGVEAAVAAAAVRQILDPLEAHAQVERERLRYSNVVLDEGVAIREFPGAVENARNIERKVDIADRRTVASRSY